MVNEHLRGLRIGNWMALTFEESVHADRIANVIAESEKGDSYGAFSRHLKKCGFGSADIWAVSHVEQQHPDALDAWRKRNAL